MWKSLLKPRCNEEESGKNNTAEYGKKGKERMYDPSEYVIYEVWGSTKALVNWEFVHMFESYGAALRDLENLRHESADKRFEIFVSKRSKMTAEDFERIWKNRDDDKHKNQSPMKILT